MYRFLANSAQQMCWKATPIAHTLHWITLHNGFLPYIMFLFCKTCLMLIKGNVQKYLGGGWAACFPPDPV